MKRIMKNKKAVSEIVGTIMLLGMAIALFTLVQFMAINYPFNEPNPSVRLSAAIDGDIVVVVHQGGGALSMDTEITFVVIHEDGTSESPYVLTPDDDWTIGEKIKYDISSISNVKEVRITIIDVESNSVIMQGTVMGGN